MNGSIPGGRGDSARGFVLVGVVMLVLALTILGLSLFSLSSFESQFLGRSLAGACAFHAANGGLDRARFALAATESLQSVGVGLPEHVVSTIAMQAQGEDTVTTGQILWGGGPVSIRVVAECNGTRRAVEAQFTPQRPVDPYTRLITSSSWVTVPLSAPGEPDTVRRRPQAWLDGPVHQSSGSQEWNRDTPGSRPPPTFGPVPSPDVRTFLASNWDAAGDVEVRSSCTLHASGGNGFFRTRYGSSGEWSFKNASQTHIDVTGRVVWMFDRGFCSDGLVTVHGDRDNGDCLVMVAEPGGVGDGPGGIVFNGGLWSNIPLVLVSDGEVRIWDFPGTSDSQAGVSIYADGVSILGPLPEDSDGDGTPDFLRLSYDLSGALLTALHGHQLVPVASPGALSEFAMVPGRWRELPPGN